jgi:hypothetical protein
MMPDYWHNDEDNDEEVAPQFCEPTSVLDNEEEEDEAE